MVQNLATKTINTNFMTEYIFFWVGDLDEWVGQVPKKGRHAPLFFMQMVCT